VRTAAATSEKLAALAERFREKLADPKDKDDKRWAKRCLDRIEARLAKKQRAIEWKLAH